MKQLYSLEAVDNLIDKYLQHNGTIYTIEGCLVDNYICIADGYKSAIIKEQYINSWSSASTITMYNKLPDKYAKVIEALEQDADGYAHDLFFK